MDECRRTITQFLARDLRGWTGLVAGCSEAETVAWLKPLDPGRSARLGTLDLEYTVRAVEAEGFNEPVMLHFREGLLALIRTEYWSFHAFECAALLEALGEPSHRSDLLWLDQVHPEGEWVYAEHGLTLGVVPQSGLIVTASVYPALDDSAYRANFARVRPGREFPAPSG